MAKGSLGGGAVRKDRDTAAFYHSQKVCVVLLSVVKQLCYQHTCVRLHNCSQPTVTPPQEANAPLTPYAILAQD